MLTRRGWLTAGAALAGSPALAVVPAAATARGAGGSLVMPGRPAPEFVLAQRPSGGPDYGPALAALRAYALEELRAVGLPGMTLSVISDDGLVALLPLGWADVANQIPVASDHLFQIGSISKSFIALTLLALADAGKVDIDAPVSRYLPDVALPPEPVTIAQLLSHKGGLPDGAPIFPRVPDGRLWCGFAPGSSFSYSNTGYDLLGAVIERVAGAPRPATVQRLVIDRLRTTGGIFPVIAPEKRARAAVGYWPWNGWGPEVPGIRMEAAYWTPEDTAAGSVAADSRAMSAYLKLLIQLGRGQGAGVVSDAAARRFVSAAGATKDVFGAGARYGFGVGIVPIDGVDALHHTGGMMSFSSSFHVDPAAGVGCFSSVNARNGEYRPRLTTAYAISLLRAVRAGRPLPPPPDALAAWAVKTPQPLAGRWVHDQRGLDLAVDGPRLMLNGPAGASPVFSGGEADRLLSVDPQFAAFGFDVERRNGTPTRLWWRGDAFQRPGSPPAPEADPKLLPMAGVYLNRDPWVGVAAVHVRGDKLWLEGQGQLIDRGGYWSLTKDPGGVERLRFEAPLNGRFTRLNVSGADLIRLDVPLSPTADVL